MSCYLDAHCDGLFGLLLLRLGGLCHSLDEFDCDLGYGECVALRVAILGCAASPDALPRIRQDVPVASAELLTAAALAAEECRPCEGRRCDGELGAYLPAQGELVAATRDRVTRRRGTFA